MKRTPLTRRTGLRRRAVLRLVSPKRRLEDAVYAANRAVVYERDGGCCVICGDSLPRTLFEAHHRLPRSATGRKHPHRHCPCLLVTTHFSCHARRITDATGQLLEAALVNGWLISRYDKREPRDVPMLVKRPEPRWVRLDCDGQATELGAA